MTSVIVCASNDVKAVLMATIEESKMGDEVKNAIFNELENLPGCEGMLPLDFDDVKSARGKGTRKKRKPSAYNLFIGDCMNQKNIKSFSEAGGAMKSCAADWKKGGAKLKKKYEALKEQGRSGKGPLKATV